MTVRRMLRFAVGEGDEWLTREIEIVLTDEDMPECKAMSARDKYVFLIFEADALLAKECDNLNMKRMLATSLKQRMASYEKVRRSISLEFIESTS